MAPLVTRRGINNGIILSGNILIYNLDNILKNTPIGDLCKVLIIVKLRVLSQLLVISFEVYKH